MVDLWVMLGRGMFKKKETAKIVGGAVVSRSIDPQDTVVFLGLPGYSVTNMGNKRLTLFYDEREKRLLRFSELADSGEMDITAALTKNLTLSSRAAQASLGLQNMQNDAYKWIFAIVLLVAVMGMVFMYLMATNGGAHSATTTIVQSPFIHMNSS